MVMVRVFCPENDMDELISIHQRHFENEFPFPGHTQQPFLEEKYVVTDEHSNIITFGAFAITLEGIILTDKSRPIRERREALYKLFQAMSFTAGARGFNMFHCTVQDEKWLRHLKKIGFKEIKGEYLYYPIIGEKNG